MSAWYAVEGAAQLLRVRQAGLFRRDKAAAVQPQPVHGNGHARQRGGIQPQVVRQCQVIGLQKLGWLLGRRGQL